MRVAFYTQAGKKPYAPCLRLVERVPRAAAYRRYHPAHGYYRSPSTDPLAVALQG